MLIPLSRCRLGGPSRITTNRRRGNYGCFFFHEKLVVEISLGVGIVPASFLMAKLAAVNDAYGIRPEIMSVFGVGLAAAGEDWSMQMHARCLNNRFGVLSQVVKKLE